MIADLSRPRVHRESVFSASDVLCHSSTVRSPTRQLRPREAVERGEALDRRRRERTWISPPSRGRVSRPTRPGTRRPIAHEARCGARGLAAPDRRSGRQHLIECRNAVLSRNSEVTKRSRQSAEAHATSGFGVQARPQHSIEFGQIRAIRIRRHRCAGNRAAVSSLQKSRLRVPINNRKQPRQVRHGRRAGQALNCRIYLRGLDTDSVLASRRRSPSERAVSDLCANLPEQVRTEKPSTAVEQ